MPLLFLSLAFLAGILLAGQFHLSTAAWLGLSAVGPGLWLVGRWGQRMKKHLPSWMQQLAARLQQSWMHWKSRFTGSGVKWRLPLPIGVLSCALFLGAARYQSIQPNPSPAWVGWYNDRDTPFVVEGRLAAPPDYRDGYIQLKVAVERLRPVGDLLFQEVEGLLLAVAPLGQTWHYGDRVRLEGNLQTPADTELFSYRTFLARQGIYSQMTQVEAHWLGNAANPLLAGIFAVREKAQAVIYQVYPDPEASLLAGILLGIESGIPLPVQQAFTRTGTAHIIAISGFNITILASLFTTLFGRWFGRWRGAAVAIVVIGFYTVLAGASPAVVRAALMGSLSVFGSQFGRRQHGINSLTFVAALMALFQPTVIWEVGFQLSFMATLGLILYATPWTQALQGFAGRYVSLAQSQKLAQWVGEYFLFTLAAQLLTLPVTLYHFQRLSISALIANPLILPVQPAVMIWSGFAVFVGMAFLPLGQLLAYLAWPFSLYSIRVVEACAALPGGMFVSASWSLWAVGFYYSVLFIWSLAGQGLRGWLQSQQSWLKPGIPLLLLSLLAVLAWREVSLAPDGLLHISVLDVDGGTVSGEAILIQSPNGRYLLLNGGPSATRLADGLGRRLPLSHRSLDFVVVGGVEEGQLRGLPPLLERIPVEQVLWAGPTHATRASRTLYEAMLTQGVPRQPAQSGQSLDLGEGAKLQVLFVGRRGGIFLLTYGSFRALLPLGVDLEAIEALPSPGSVTAMLLADSGYAPANPAGWLAALRPQVFLLSVSRQDLSGRPSPELLELIAGYPLLRTDQHGAITLSTDGEKMWIQTEYFRIEDNKK